MLTKDVDIVKRRALLRASKWMGVIAAGFAAIPFVGSMLPSARAVAAGAPVKVDLTELKPGDQMTVMWRGKPIWIIHRRPEAIELLKQMNAVLSDPDSALPQQPEFARNPFRSIRPEYLVLVGVCTHLGCSPTYRPDREGVERGWPGGFFCSCHGSKFDLSGRVYKGVPAPSNLEVPPHHFLSDTSLLIGENA